MKCKATLTKLVCFTGSLVISSRSAAQITVSANDILAQIGTSQMTESDTTGSVTVNLGAAGTNQTWDFRPLILQASTSTNQFLTPQNTPFAAQFPQSNFVVKITSADEPGFEIYSYLQVAGNGVQSLGGAVKSPDTTAVLPTGPSGVTPLPLQFNAAWNSVVSDTFGDPQTFASITITRENNLVDAWGRVRLAAGDFDCLRLRTDTQNISLTIFLGNVFADTTTTIEYAWVARDQYFVAQASSRDNETNPNFTEAQSFSRLTAVTTAVASPAAEGAIPAGFELRQNFPNPFNPETQIQFQVLQAGRVELSVFNLAGEKVRTLASTLLPAGTHTFKWDGKNDTGNRLPSGVYLYRLHSGTFEQARTMLLLK